MLLQGKNSLSSSSDSKITVKETFKEAGMENLYLQLYMNILLMVLATARDKIRLAKSVGRRSNCCWDSGGSFDREGHKHMSHVPCGFWHILVYELISPTYLRNDGNNWQKFWQRCYFIHHKRKFICATTFLLYGTVISRNLQNLYTMNKTNKGSKQKL